MTLRKLAFGSYDPATGTQSSSTPTDYTFKGYAAEYLLSEINNDSILMGDREVLLPALDTSGDALPEPDSEDIILGLGDQVVVKSVQRIYNKSSIVAYLCQVRG